MTPSTTASPRSRTVTLVLAFLLFIFGVGGIHRFYTGRIISGIVQFFTLGGFGIWQIIDILRIIFGTYEDAQGREVNEW